MDRINPALDGIVDGTLRDWDSGSHRPLFLCISPPSPGVSKTVCALQNVVRVILTTLVTDGLARGPTHVPLRTLSVIARVCTYVLVL